MNARKISQASVAAAALLSAVAVGQGGASAASGHTAAASSTQQSYSKVSAANGWKIQTLSRDACNTGSAYDEVSVSEFSNQAGTFTCGSLADSLEVCKADANNIATCVRDFATKDAVRFKLTAPLKYSGDTSRPWHRPLQIKLTNGETYAPTLHDGQHAGGRHGWYASGSATLLQNAKTGAYFDKSTPVWTAERAVGMKAPTRVGVASTSYVVF